MVGTAHGAKGFDIETDGGARHVHCRDVRGFPGALDAVRRGERGPDRLVLVVPDIAMDDWLARWADDLSSVHRTLSMTRRSDGRRIRFEATLLTYGYGVDTVLGVTRLIEELPPLAAPRVPTTSTVRAKVDVPKVAAGPLRRKMSRG